MEIKETLLGDYTLFDYFKFYEERREEYIKGAKELLSNKVISKSIGVINKSKLLAVLLQKKDKKGFIELFDLIDLPEIVRACEILDSNRYIRQLEREIKNKSGKDKKNKKNKVYKTKVNKISLLKKLNENIDNDIIVLSLTSSKVKMIKMWVNNLDERDLIFRALMFPKELWKKLADLCHFNPSKDFKLDWFLSYCFDGKAPQNSILDKINNINDHNNGELLSICEEYKLPYELARIKISKSDNIKVTEYYVKNENMDTILWYFDEFEKFDKIIENRLRKTEITNLPYGKIMALLLKTYGKYMRIFSELVRLAETRLMNYRIKIDGKVAVLGDASASMQIAINTSSIITSLLSYLADAELHLFKTKDIPIVNPPKNVLDVVKFSKQMSADGTTSPSSSLYYYFKNAILVDTFIIITDEEENTGYDGTSIYYNNYGNMEKTFAKLYRKYCENIYASRLIFISFTEPNEDGFMIKELKKEMGEKFVKEFVEIYKFNTDNPDLTRLDYLLEKLSVKKNNIEFDNDYSESEYINNLVKKFIIK